MSLTFLTPLMLAGAVLVAAPIILHLVMRQQPKHLIFPALRFIRQRNDANKRRLKLRHISAVGAALRGDRLSGAGIGAPERCNRPDFWAIKKRRSLPRWCSTPRRGCNIGIRIKLGWKWPRKSPIVCSTQLPAESDVAVLDSRTADRRIFHRCRRRQAAHRTAGRSADAAQSLPELCDEALRLVAEDTKTRKEDLRVHRPGPRRLVGRIRRAAAQQACRKDGCRALRDRCRRRKSAEFALAICGFRPMRWPRTRRSGWKPTLQRRHARRRTNRRAGFLDAAGSRSAAIKPPSKPSPDQSQPIDFQIGGLELGTHQGIVRIVGEDSFAGRRRSLLHRRRAAAVESAGRRRSRTSTTRRHSPKRSLRQPCVAPAKLGLSAKLSTLDELAAKSLDDYAAVCLLDPPPLANQTWESLARFVDRGGGLAIWLGRNAQPQGPRRRRLQHRRAQKLMPGKLARSWRRQDAFLAPPDYQHPLLAKFRTMTGGVPWEDFPVASHWQLTDMADGVNTIIPYSNGQPALLERSVGKGRVLLFTTPISDDATQADLWNTLVVGSGSWPFFMLTNEMLLYLAASGEERLNYNAGETVVIRLPESQRQLMFSLRSPDGEEILTGDRSENRHNYD